MESNISDVYGPRIPLSCLRLLLSPLRLVSAAIWQTVEQKVVSDYGLLDEFVSLVTDIVPELLPARQKAELTFGLRARLILELCRSEETAALDIIEPHLDRIQMLQSLWDVESDYANMEISSSHFLGLVHSLLRDPKERDNFFQDVFPEEFGSLYDKAIQTVMWQFLSRLEKLIPVQTIQQVASLLNNSCVLNECIESISQPHDLRELLEYQKDLIQLEKDDSFSDTYYDTAILSSLCLPPVERVVIVNEETGAHTEGRLVYTVCTDIEQDSEEKYIYVDGTTHPGEGVESPQWFSISSDVKPEDSAVLVTELEEDIIPSEETCVADTSNENEIEKPKPHDVPEAMENREHLTIENVVMVCSEDNSEKETGIRKKTKTSTDGYGANRDLVKLDCVAVLKKMDMPGLLSSRPVRQNRGLKMKTYLLQRKTSRQLESVSKSPKHDITQDSTNNNHVQRQHNVSAKMVSHILSVQRSTKKTHFCSACERRYATSWYLKQHRCRNKGVQSQSKQRHLSKRQETSTDFRLTADEGEVSPSGAPAELDPDLPSESISQEDPDYSPPAPLPSRQKRSIRDKSLAGPFICLHCSVEFKCRQTFKSHLRNVCYQDQQVDPEKVEGAEQCDNCDKAFKFKSALESHKRTHNPLYCEVCMKLVRDTDALELHKISHTPFQCNQCEENFPLFKVLYKHHIDVHNPSGPFVCGHCETVFTSLKRFIRHGWRHSGHLPFQCPHCPKRFRSYSDLLEHQRIHTKVFPYLCWECGKKFRHSITLTRHIQRDHRPDKAIPDISPITIFPCSQCDKSFTAKRNLQNHVNFHHNGVRYPCGHCGKGFSGKDSLVRHSLIHTGERPFECNECGKCFRSASEVKVHTRYHTGERPFKCHLCDKAFVQSSFLTLHMRTHTGERPYVCCNCEKGFASLHGLKRHKKLVHT